VFSAHNFLKPCMHPCL